MLRICTISLLSLLLVSSAYGDEIISDFEEDSVPVINEELRQIDQDITTNATSVTTNAASITTNTSAIAAVQEIKAWINFNGTGTPAARDSFNVTSITDLGVGEYTIVWATDFANDDYVVSVCTNGLADATRQYDSKLNFDTPQATTGCSILCSSGDAGSNWTPGDFTVIHVIALGDQ